MAEADRPALSVVVAIVSDTMGPPDTRHLEPCLAALMRQRGAPATEIIVPHLPGMAGIAALGEEHPNVHFVEAELPRTYTGRGGSREHHDELRARGLAVARGSIVALIEDHGIPAPDWSARVYAHLSHAHLLEASLGRPLAAVGGAIENEVHRPLKSAAYFCDFLRYHNPLHNPDSGFSSASN